MSDKVYDLIIVGAGPAGLTASLYATRAMLDSITLEQMGAGGQILTTPEIDNYPGVPNTDGFTLADLMKKQAEGLGASIVMEDVKKINKNQETGLFEVETSKGILNSRTVIVATGAKPRQAGFEGEEQFRGRGVSYCATCDAMFYRGKHVYVIGGGNSAVGEALFLANIVDHVTVIVRKDHMRAQVALQERLEAADNVDIMYNTSIVKVEGDNALNAITFRNNLTQELDRQEFDEASRGVFVFVGHVPVTETLGDLVDYSQSGAVLTDEWMATKTEGLYCAGDIRQCPIRQIVTAAADGAIATSAAAIYLGQNINS